MGVAGAGVALPAFLELRALVGLDDIDADADGFGVEVVDHACTLRAYAGPDQP